MKLTEAQINKMIKLAKSAKNHAFAARSEHEIGACVLTLNNKYFYGCNIESNISGLGICAERCAINNAVSAGYYKFKALLVYDNNPGTIPCGACIQYLTEFSRFQDTVILSACEAETISLTMTDILPKAYISKNLDKYIPYA